MSVIQPRTATVDIYQGDYLDRIRHLEQRFEAALKSEETTTRTVADQHESAAIAEEHRALVAEAEESKIVVTVGALGRKGWRKLVSEHPPRKNGDATEAEVASDAAMGVNEDSFKEELVPLSILSPTLTEDDFDSMSDIDYDRIYYTAWALNRAPAASPKALVSPA